MKITREQAEQVRPIVQRIAKARCELEDAANELEAALGQYFSVTRVGVSRRRGRTHR